MINAIRNYMAANGRKGGKSGTGAAKRRPPEHYAKMNEAKKKKRKAKK